MIHAYLWAKGVDRFHVVGSMKSVTGPMVSYKVEAPATLCQRVGTITFVIKRTFEKGLKLITDSLRDPNEKPVQFELRMPDDHKTKLIFQAIPFEIHLEKVSTLKLQIKGPVEII